MPKGKPNKRYTPEFKIKVEVEEDLIAEVQRLRAENAYLKKLNALVAERVRQEKKKKSLDAEQYALKEILIFMEKADLNRQVSLASAIMDCRKARMHLSFCAKTDTGIS